MRKYRNVAREMREMERVAVSNPRVRRVLTAAPLVLVFALLGAQPARSACSFSPSPDPTIDGAPASLRAAIQGANAAGQDCQINLPIGTYTLTIANTNGQDNTAAEGDLDITSSGHTITLRGASETDTVINANGIDRAFQVLGGANATFRNLTIEGGVANDNGVAGALPGTTKAEGGGVFVQDGGHVEFIQTLLQSNQAIGGPGKNGVDKTYRTAPSILRGNSGGSGKLAAGGGLFVNAGTVDLRNSQISGNTAAGGMGGRGGLAIVQVGSYPSAMAFGSAGAGGDGTGGGLYLLSGSATFSQSTISGNSATGGLGGAPAILVDHGLLFEGPAGDGGATRGAGLSVSLGILDVKQTTISNNQATAGNGGESGCNTSRFIGATVGNGGLAQGAGMFVAVGAIRVANSTIFANTAQAGSGGYTPPCSTTAKSRQGTGGAALGGGLYAGSGSVSLTGVTIASNQALASGVQGSSSGGGINNAGANITTDTALIGDNLQDFGNLSNGNDVFGAITSSFTLIGQTEGAVITDNGHNILDVDPALDPSGLRPNGGPTETVALLNNSVAIDTGDAAVCAEAPAAGGLGSVDQRGFHRFDSGDTFCDIGAFEVNKAARGAGH